MNKFFIRKKIRQLILKEVVSKPDVILGDFKDDIIIDKEKIRPNYIDVVYRNAKNVCDGLKTTDKDIECPVNYDIEKTFHSYQRQFRHISDGGDVIEDEELKDTIEKGVDDIVKKLLFKTVFPGDKSLIKNTKTNLNVVVSPSLIKSHSNKIRFYVITLMKKDDFKTLNTKIVKVY